MRSSRSGPDPLDPGPVGFAHRGLHGPGVPENSIAAFAAAIDLGAGIECDVRLSGDGEAVVFHDPDLGRLCGPHHQTEQTPMSLLETQRLLGTEQTIPRLRDLLELVGTRVPLLIELKTRSGNAERLSAAVMTDLAGFQGLAGVMSFDPRVCAWLARHHPEALRGLVLSGRDRWFVRWFKMLIARPDFLALKISEVGRSWVKASRRGRPIYWWTVRSAEDRNLAAAQGDALIWEADGRG